jgi:hypothetical protein
MFPEARIERVSRPHHAGTRATGQLRLDYVLVTPRRTASNMGTLSSDR